MNVMINPELAGRLRSLLPAHPAATTDEVVSAAVLAYLEAAPAERARMRQQFADWRSTRGSAHRPASMSAIQAGQYMTRG